MAPQGAKIFLFVFPVVQSLRRGNRPHSEVEAHSEVQVEAGDCFSDYDRQPYLNIAVHGDGMRQILADQIEELGCTDMGQTHSSISAICDKKAARTLQRVFSDETTVISSDAGSYFREMSGVGVKYTSKAASLSTDFYSDWRMYADRMDRISEIVSDCGGAATFESIGKSLEGRDISAVRFTGAGYTAGMPRVIVGFQQHAREWIVGMAGVHAVETTCSKVKQDPTWLDGMEVVFIPCANPDGTLYSETKKRMHRKNMRNNSKSFCKGVDLNRNWGVNWGGEGSSDSKCSDAYMGTSAWSEPEVQVQKALIDKAYTTLHLDMHAFMQMVLRPWAYTLDAHPRKAELDVVGMAMRDAMQARHGKTYKYGGAEMLYPASGVSADYVSSKGGFGFGFELRPESPILTGGFSPPVGEILPSAEEAWAAIETGIRFAKSPWTTTTTTPPPTPAPAPPPYSCGFLCTKIQCFLPRCKTCSFC